MAAIATQLPPSTPVGTHQCPPSTLTTNTITEPTTEQNTADNNDPDATSPINLDLHATSPINLDLHATHLISSPYSDFENQLRLAHLDTPYQLFAFALTALKPTRPDYATAPYLDSFNWPEVFAVLRSLCKQTAHQWGEQRFYVVIFRSKLKAGIDRERLGLLDQMSHREACASGGLLKYWFGSTDGELRNLATCLWRNHEDAVEGGGGPWHAQARLAARTMYEYINFGVHQMVVQAGAESWRMEDYKP